MLAFDNLSDDPEMAFFSEGVSEEIQQTVARGADLTVIGRTSSFQFRGADKAAARIAKVLKATHVLDGSVRRSGTRVRISAQLVECSGETTLWSESFDRDLTDIFALQDEIAASVAAALKTAFAPTGLSEPIDPVAYDLYLAALRARENEFLVNPATLNSAIKLVEQATALAPRFAGAWAHLADLRRLDLRFGQIQPDAPTLPFAVRRAKVVDAAEMALSLDPGLGRVYQVLGSLAPFGEYLAREAIENKALSVSPNDPGVLHEASQFVADVGRIHEALGYVRRAHELDPMSVGAASWFASMLDAEGRYEESRPLWDRFRVLWPASDLVAWNAVASAASNADWLRFEDLVRAIRKDGMYNVPMRRLVWFGRNLRDPDQASMKAALEQSRDEIARSGSAPLDGLTSLYRLGFKDEVFDLID
ncbi:MAG TPA: hypothetical protein VGG92_21625, partial [Caulobacteraceae bacterium]